MFDWAKKIGWFGRFAALCLAVCLLTGCGGADNAPPETPASPGASAEVPAEPELPKQPEPDAPDSKEEPGEEPGAESPAESPASSDAEEVPEEQPDLIYTILDHRSVEAVCKGKKGTLVLAKVRAENLGKGAAHLHNTVESLGNVTLETAEDGLTADKILDGEKMGSLAARVWTGKEIRGMEPVTAAVNGASEALGGGQSAELYWYVFLSDEEENWTRLDFLEGDDRVGYLTPKPVQK